jgi:hypothetical protein
MAHEDAGHYAAKHPAGTACSPAVAAALRERAENSRVTCSAAMEVVKEFGVDPSEVGKTLDLLEFRITKCQLGLFGYQPEKKIVQPATDVPADLRARLQAAAAEDSLSCASCWDVADELRIAKMEISAVCEALGLKVRPCQLGAF